MYSREVPLIKRKVFEGGPEDLLDVISFVLLTIRVPFSRVKSQCLDVKSLGESSSSLWGFKRQGFLYAKENLDTMYKQIVDDRCSTVGALRTLLRVPGLGLAKAGFVGQCLGYPVCCVDTHNLKRLGLDPGILKYSSKKPEPSIELYLETTMSIGASEWWWNSWCEYVANNRVNKTLPTADRVSRYHWECIHDDKT